MLIIVSDPAFVHLKKETKYKGQIHLSTLANMSFAGGMKTAKELGISRVVIPRELNVEKIRKMAEECPPAVDLEIFIHGTLCYGVSGRCYWSSFYGGKSGLRGRCVQPCRRIYEQKGNKKRFFSCQDLSLNTLVKVLLEIPQIKTWKIEGRKKGPHYVYYTVTAYKMLRDHGTDPQMKKTALGLLQRALGRPNTHYNPHLHAIVSDGCFSKDGDFHMAPGFILEDLEEIFQYEVLKMLKKEGKITLWRFLKFKLQRIIPGIVKPLILFKK